MDGNNELEGLKQSQQESLNPESQTLEAGGVGWFKRLKDRFGGVFKSEKKIGGHKVTIDVFYNKHRGAEETKGMEDQFQKADIYIPEVFGWTPEYLNDLRKLSNGDATPDEVLQKMGEKNPHYYSRDKNLFNLIYNSKKPITVIDIPEGHPLDDREREIKFPKIQFGSGFGQPLDSVREYIKKSSVMEKEREAYMFGQFEPKIQELINTHPELARRQQINALLSIGGAHMLLSNKLKNEYQITKEFSAAPRIFLYKEEAMIRYMFGKPVDDELVARIVAEQLLSIAHNKLFVTDDSIGDVKSVRKLVSRFSFNDMKNMFERARDLDEWADSFVQRSKEELKVAATVS